LSERIPAAAGIVNLRYKSCPEMAGQDQCSYHNASQKIILIIFVHICMYTFENKRMRMQPRNFGETQNRFCEKWL
ncbi:hypothetical protein ACNDRN_003185, partial [Escherichia coli]